MKRLILSVIFGLLLMLLAVALSGCKSIKYVPVESEKLVYVDREKRDSIHIYDSIYIREKSGTRIDTLEITRWRTEYREFLKIDSVFIRDSVQVPYPVEKQLTRWQAVKMDIGGIAMGGLIAIILALILWIIIKRK